LNNASGALEAYYHPILSADEAIERSLVELRLGTVVTPTRTVAKLLTERVYEEWMYDGSAITESDQPFWVVAFEIPEQSASSVMMFADSEDRVTGVFYGWSALQGGGRSHRTGEIGPQWNTSLDSLEALPDYPMPIETPSAIPTRRVFDK
jgi:hypothetical protein